MRVRGKYIDDRKRFLVFEILRCSAPFPASSVRADRPQKRRNDAAPMRRLTKAVATENETISIDESSDPTPDLLPEEADIVATPVFAATMAGRASDGEREDATAFVTQSGDGTTFSVGEEQMGGNEPIELVPAEDDDELFVLSGKSAIVSTADRDAIVGVLLASAPAQSIGLQSTQTMVKSSRSIWKAFAQSR